jgi:hypothetical protein
MIMVIFGAGASYDSVPSTRPEAFPSHPNRPPLAAHLFDERFTVVVKEFPQCIPIIPELRAVSTTGDTIEHRLEKFQEEGKTDAERLRQLAAIRYYIRDLISMCDMDWDRVAGGLTNQAVLLDQLRRVRACFEPESILLVTFNYDRMIERALAAHHNMPISQLQHYIESDTFKLFKLHGSVEWVHRVTSRVVCPTPHSAKAMAHELIKNAPNLELADQFIMVKGFSIEQAGDIPLFPAIALPVETKTAFECPADHLDCFREHLGKITKVVTIGWAAQEQHFLKELKEGLTEKVSIFAVASGEQDAKKVIERIKDAGIGIRDDEAAQGGFTQCTVNREFERFCLTERSPRRPVQRHG